MTGRTGAAVVVLAGVLAAAPRATAAQRLSGSVVAHTVQNHVRFADTVIEQTGTWFGAEGAVQISMVRLGVSGLIGSLAGDGGAAHPDRDVRVSSVTLHVFPAPWIGMGAEAEAKRFETDLGVTAWRLIGGNIRLTPQFGSSGLRGLAELSYFASAEVVDGPSIDRAVRGVFGVSYEPPRAPVSVRLAYRLERFDFAAQGAAVPRLEQFRGAVVAAGLRLGRRP